MKIIVCGAGQYGYDIAERLCREGHDVYVVDKEEYLISRINEGLDVTAIQGHAADPEVLEFMQAKEADVFIAFTREDEVNIVACQAAHSIFKVRTKIARIRNTHYLSNRWGAIFDKESFPVTEVVSPELNVARSIAKRVQVPGAMDIFSALDKKVRVLCLRVKQDNPLVDVPVKDYARILKDLCEDLRFRVMATVREGRMLSVDSSHVIKEGDKIYIAVSADYIFDIQEIFGFEELESTRIVILGGGLIAEHLITQLQKDESKIYRISVVVEDKDRAEYLVRNFNKISVIKGDISNENILKEARANKADMVIALTDHDEVNLLVSLMTKKMGAVWNMVLLNQYDFRTLNDELKVDVMIQPQDIAMSGILPHLRRGRLHHVHSVHGGKAEIMEVKVVEDSDLLGVAVSDIPKIQGVTLGFIERHGGLLLPKKDTVLQKGDKLLVFALKTAVSHLEDMISGAGV